MPCRVLKANLPVPPSPCRSPVAERQPRSWRLLQQEFRPAAYSGPHSRQ